MADVHRVLGTLPDDADQMGTADGRDKTVEASRARLARMVGADAADADDAAWHALAAQCRYLEGRVSCTTLCPDSGADSPQGARQYQ